MLAGAPISLRQSLANSQRVDTRDPEDEISAVGSSLPTLGAPILLYHQRPIAGNKSDHGRSATSPVQPGPAQQRG